jgi:hypothetical protein
MGSAVPAAAADVIVVNAVGGAPPNFAQDFWQEFRNIASTAPGRKLLYKILIEIRRVNTANVNQHLYASGTERVGGMSLTVTPAASTVFVNKESITFNQAHAGDLLNALQRYYSFLTTLATLPANTPHYAGENITGVHGASTVNDQFTHIQIPMPGGAAANVNIYFPIDGHQPTTPNAVVWACANIDNREHSPITEWYMMMFGVIPLPAGGGGGAPAVYVQAGWNNPAVNPQQIISFDAGFNGASMVTYPESVISVSRKDLFVQNFRKIASTSVGRILLYRILIEIRRHAAVGNVGVLDHGIPGVLPPDRNTCRSIAINWDFDSFYFAMRGEIGLNNLTVGLSSLGNSGIEVAGSYDSIVIHKLPVDVSLFHEMNHWYHFLRYPERYMNERNDYNRGLDIEGLQTAVNIIGLANIPQLAATAALGVHYWGGLGGWHNKGISEENWQITRDDGANREQRVHFEELRNILGVERGVVLPLGGAVFHGDDLSENLYRMCIGMPLRFGYVADEYYEDSRVIDKVVASCNSWKGYYNFFLRRNSNAEFDYANGTNRQGIGRCKIK